MYSQVYMILSYIQNAFLYAQKSRIGAYKDYKFKCLQLSKYIFDFLLHFIRLYDEYCLFV